MSQSRVIPQQRIIISFVQAQDFAAVEALIPDLKRRAEGFGRPQSFDGVADGLSRCRKAPVFLAAILGTLCQKQFSGCVVVEGHALAHEGHTLRSSLSLATRSWGSLMLLIR